MHRSTTLLYEQNNKNNTVNQIQNINLKLNKNKIRLCS